MKIQLQLAAALAALLMTSNAFPVYAASTDILPEATASSQTDTSISDSVAPEEWETVTLGDPFPSEAPQFTAHIELATDGYIVKGTFTEFPSDISLVQPMYSLNGETWEMCGNDWDLYWLEEEGAGTLEKLQNQICLYSNQEPLKSYLAGNLDRFNLKLRLVRKNGFTYETQTATIDRGSVQEIPAGMNIGAMFSQSMLVRETNPFRYYGRYQLTVSEDATPEDISAYLPDTLPVCVSLNNGIRNVADCIVDCPVTWKPLSLQQLTAGESVTVLDAAEEIVIPSGTLLRTPLGDFRLNEPLGIESYGITDEVRLVLNVVRKDENPAGVLSAQYAGLEMAFDLKPTGATAIRSYVLSQGESEWTELATSSLLDAVNAQPSTASSGYAFVLSSSEEPYRSYLTAEYTESAATPFLIGLKIEGGVYDGRQLILSWPDTYEGPAQLPALGGAGGNEGNAGAGNSGDSTAEGQRPNLPQKPELPQNPKDEQNAQNPSLPQDPKNPQTEQLRSHGDEADAHAAVKDVSFTRLSTAEIVSSPNTGDESVFHCFLLPAAAMLPIGICIIIAARKIDTPG